MRTAATRRALARAVIPTQYHRFQSTSTQAITPITSVLIANRGEIALRVGRTAKEHGIRCTTIYTDPDATSQHALSSPFAINLGAPSAYLDGDRIISVAKQQGCQALHPGYGFLSENSEFAKRCVEEGLIFIGPPWRAIEDMGNKSRSKEIMLAAGVPCIPGYHGKEQDPQYLMAEARKIGFPVMVKAVAGGGGKGMRIVLHEAEFLEKLENAKSEGRNSFGDDVMLVEKYIQTPRHIEVQVFADKHGNAVALGERDCSLQRRHQKILEEAPAPNLAEDIRQDLWGKARAAALAVGYEGAGTVEFIFDNDTNEFFFMEMNTRLQVEHPVTEEVTGEDLVSWQFKIAAGEKLPLTQDEIAQRIRERGWALEARIYAENPAQDFMPDAGQLVHLKAPESSDHVRIDAGFVQGDVISSAYDPMIAKLIVSGPTREIALRRMHTALSDYEIVGIHTNIEFLKRVCQSQDFMDGQVETGYIKKHHDELFPEESVAPETYVQAALGLFFKATCNAGSEFLLGSGPHGQSLTFPSTASRAFHFTAPKSADSANPSSIVVELAQHGPDLFSASVSGAGIDTHYENITTAYTPSAHHLTTYYPHTRLTSTIIPSPSSTAQIPQTLTLFTQGSSTILTIVPPPWHAAALGVREATNSVLAPMPCKVLRNEVKVGDEVVAGQALVVIESMKMETVIRSPGAGIVSRVKGAGEVCKAGTVLVEFEEEGEGGKEK